MSENPIHLDVYKERSVLHYETTTTTYDEGNQSAAASARYNAIKSKLEGNYLDNIYDEPYNEEEDSLSEKAMQLLNALVDKLTSEVGRGLLGLTFLQLTIKSISPEQSIRLHKGGNRTGTFKWKEGISMRSLDKHYNTPFLRRKKLLSLNADGSFMTRALAENYPYSRLYKAEMRGPFIEWISIVDAIEDGSLPAKEGLKYLMSLLKNKSENFVKLANNTIALLEGHRGDSFEEIESLLIDFFENTKYSARAYEVVMHGFVQALTEDDSLGPELQPMTQMRSANKKHGNIGDVELKEGAVVVEAWDAKFGKTYLYEELGEIEDKLGPSSDVSVAGFVVDKDIRKNDDIEERRIEVEATTGTNIYLFNFNEWVDYKLNEYGIVNSEDKNVFGYKWLTAVVESFAQRRREKAPIDEPCDEWLQSLNERLKKERDD